MNAKELQIGDLVDYRGKVIEVTSLYAKNGSNEVGFGNKEDIWVNGCVLNPIPLTSEILEKNGFVKEIVTNDDTNDDYTAYHWNPTPQYPSDGLWFYPTFSGYAFDYIMSKIKIKYVHELQHLLRLCGIDKEITL